MERVRNMWNEILNAGLNQYSSYWMKYINIEMYVYQKQKLKKKQNHYTNYKFISTIQFIRFTKYFFIFSQFGDQKHVRKIFARALMTNTDLPETIGTEWIRYETLYGDLDTLLNCKEKYKTKYVNCDCCYSILEFIPFIYLILIIIFQIICFHILTFKKIFSHNFFVYVKNKIFNFYMSLMK